MKHGYKVYYVGDDSHHHKMVVCANSRNEAVEKVKKATEADIITGVRRCANPYVKNAMIALAVLLFFALSIVSCVRTA